MSRPLAVVTGAGRRGGIGAAIARRLAVDGWDLLLTHWSPHDAAVVGDASAEMPALLSEVRAAGAAADAIEADFADAESVTTIIPAAARAPSALILSHATDAESDTLSTRPGELERHFAVNAAASWQLIVAFAERLTADRGSVVALTSDATLGNLPYGASKAALDRIVLAAARDLGPRGIRANLINPGPIDTGWMTPDIRTALVARQPLGRLGEPSDIADVVSFLVGPTGGWITGQLLNVDGGFSAPSA
jgi:3-oxoacyl-[acyl-carrier protein] reductase